MTDKLHPAASKPLTDFKAMNVRPQAPNGHAVSAATQRRSSLSYCILLVDDHNDTLRASAAALVRCGYEVDTAEDGESAWKALGAHNYDLLITDNIMPKLSGVELVKRLRSAKMTLPVILTSAALQAEQLKLDPWLQLAAVLPKPFISYELLEKVKQVLGTVRNGHGVETPAFGGWPRRSAPTSRGDAEVSSNEPPTRE